jgi:hypothetical protein
VSDLFLPNVTRVSCEGMVERGTIDVLRMGDRGPMREDRYCCGTAWVSPMKDCLSEQIGLDFF